MIFLCEATAGLQDLKLHFILINRTEMMRAVIIRKHFYCSACILQMHLLYLVSALLWEVNLNCSDDRWSYAGKMKLKWQKPSVAPWASTRRNGNLREMKRLNSGDFECREIGEMADSRREMQTDEIRREKAVSTMLSEMFILETNQSVHMWGGRRTTVGNCSPVQTYKWCCNPQDYWFLIMVVALPIKSGIVLMSPLLQSRCIKSVQGWGSPLLHWGEL